jgi:PhzF family phenazine biosynthesis protein
MPQTILQVDAFTNRPFAGNPAAVCVLNGPADEGWMQDVAREMNLSETSFLHWEDGSGSFRLRWFTPTVEVDLCGHATLAAAHVLWTEGHLPSDSPAWFQTRSGLLKAERRDDWIAIDLPVTPVQLLPGSMNDSASLAEVVGAPVKFAGYSRFDCLIELESEEAVRALKPDVARLAALPVRGVIVTARAETAGYDFVSRFFAPRVGIDEDPVCGSAHCCLGPYWGERLRKSEMLAYQASARGGVIRVGLRGDRVRLGGQAVTVLNGELTG